MSEALQAATRALNAATEDLKRVTAGRGRRDAAP